MAGVRNDHLPPRWGAGTKSLCEPDFCTTIDSPSSSRFPKKNHPRFFLGVAEGVASDTDSASTGVAAGSGVAIDLGCSFNGVGVGRRRGDGRANGGVLSAGLGGAVGDLSYG